MVNAPNRVLMSDLYFKHPITSRIANLNQEKDIFFGRKNRQEPLLPPFSPKEARKLSEAFVPLARIAQVRLSEDLESTSKIRRELKETVDNLETYLGNKKQEVKNFKQAKREGNDEKKVSSKNNKRELAHQIKETESAIEILRQQIQNLDARISEEVIIARLTSPEQFRDYLRDGLLNRKRIYLPGEFSMGMLCSNENLLHGDSFFKQVAQYLLADEKIKQSLIKCGYGDRGVPIIIQTRTKAALDSAKDFLEDKVINPHQLHATIYAKSNRRPWGIQSNYGWPRLGFSDYTYKDFNKHKRKMGIKHGIPWKYKTEELKPLEVKETVYWPTLEAWMTGRDTPKIQGLQTQLADRVTTYHLTLAEDIDPELSSLIQARFDKLRPRLNALEVAKAAYSERVDKKEVMMSLGMGAAIGIGGHTLIHSQFHGEGWEIFVAFAVLATVIDVFDNWYGEMGAMRSDLQGNGIHVSVWEALFGPPLTPEEKFSENMLEGFKEQYHHLKETKGEGATIVKRSMNAAFQGAAIGAMFSPFASAGLNSMNNALYGFAGGLMGTAGTGLSIPANLRKTIPQLYLTTRDLMQNGIIEIPEDIQGDEEKQKQFALDIVQQETISRIGFKASMKAFSISPVIGGAILGILPAALNLGMDMNEAILYSQKVYFAVAPAAENLSRLWFTMRELNHNVPQDMAAARALIVELAEKGTLPSQEDATKLQRFFSDGWAEKVYKALSVKVKLPQWQTVEIDRISKNKPRQKYLREQEQHLQAAKV